MDKVYADSEAGAIEFIENETQLKITEFTQFSPDPAVEGVWYVQDAALKGKDFDSTVCVTIFMAGYKEPFGGIRESNDFFDNM